MYSKIFLKGGFNMVALIFFALIAVSSVFVGIRYMNSYKSNQNNTPNWKKIAKQNEQFGVSDPEEVEIEKVYVVKPDKLGFKK